MTDFLGCQISIMSSLNDLSHRRFICTGVALESPEASAWPQIPASESDLDSLVSFYYIRLIEEWKTDVRFLEGAGGATAIGDSRLLLQRLRTARQHTNNAKAVDFRKKWIAAVTIENESLPPWEACGTELLRSVAQAMAALSQLAEIVSRSDKLREQWRELVSITPVAVVSNVAEELGLTFPKGAMERIARAVEYRFGQTGGVAAEGELRPRLEAFAECELVGRVERLPMPFRQILAHLSIRTGINAAPALRLAHVVHEMSGFDGNQLLERISLVWTVVNAPS